MTRVTIYGPNLNRAAQAKGEMHVHAEGCADGSHYGPGRKYGGDGGWTIEATTRKDVVSAIYPPEDFGYDEADWRDYDDLYVAPCVQLA